MLQRQEVPMRADAEYRSMTRFITDNLSELKPFRRIGTRYDKLDGVFVALICDVLQQKRTSPTQSRLKWREPALVECHATHRHDLRRIELATAGLGEPYEGGTETLAADRLLPWQPYQARES